MMALRADAQKELDELPTPAQLKERYPDTSRWDARLQAALHKRRPVLKRVLVAALTLVILTLGTLEMCIRDRYVVQQIAAAHGGRAVFGQNTPRGAKATVWLPVK